MANWVERAIDQADQADESAVKRSRLLLIAFFSVVGLAFAVVFLSDTSSRDLQDPPNEKLTTLAENFGGNVEYWTATDETIAFTLDLPVDPDNQLSVEEVEAQVYEQGASLELSTLRDLTVVRQSGRYKVSGFVDVED